MNLTVLKDAVTLLKALPESQVEDLDSTAKLELGQILWRLWKHSNKLLDPIRVDLRAAALTLSGGDTGPQKFEGPDAQASVMVVNSVVSIRKGADMEGLKATLGDGMFGALFETVVTYKPRKDFNTRTGACDANQTAAAFNVLDVKPGTPRVSFQD